MVSEPASRISSANTGIARRRLLALSLALALAGCSTKMIDIICPPAGVCPNTQSGHGGGY